MRVFLIAGCALSLVVACGGKQPGVGDDVDAGGDPPDACSGLPCQVANCSAVGKPPTTLTGTVFAPNGNLPLNGVTVYVPATDPGPFAEGVQCERCSDLPGSPIASTVTDDAGRFRLEFAPSGTDIPLIVTVGKWRRQLTVPVVTDCADTAVDPAATRLPRDQTEGDIPRIAITTGDADSMECLARKLGISDSEITTSAGAGRIHLYAGNGVNKLATGFAGGSGQTMTGAEPMWNSLATLKTYDIVILSCEGGQLAGNPTPTPKSQAALDAMKAYADAGGRVFASHWHNIWIGGKFQGGVGAPTPAVWSSIATWTASASDPGSPILIDESSNPKGPAFASWMLNVGGSTVRDQIALVDNTDRKTALTLDASKAERWVKTSSGDNPQMFQFTTPNEAAEEQRCGKVVFTDMHVSGTKVDNQDYPNSCVGGAGSLDLTPQEKALAFMFFDIASCVGVIL